MGMRRSVCKMYTLVIGITLIVVWSWMLLLIRLDTMAKQKRMPISESVKRSLHELDIPSLYETDTREDIQTYLAELAVAVHKAKIHARGTRTSDYLRTALDKLDVLLDKFNINKTVLYKRNEIEAGNVCPEKYMGSTYGYPFFYKGFEETNCTFGRPIQDLVTIITFDNDVDNLNKTQHNAFINSVLSVHPNIPIIIATHQTKRQHLIDTYQSVSCVDISGHQSEGDILNKMVRMASTPYVFVNRGIDVFTNDSRLSRLVREYERLSVSVVGGAWRDSKGHWSHGCYQSVNRNYTLKYVYGYDESFHECLYCDHVTGPYLSSREDLLEYPFKSYPINGGLFEDWFLRLTRMSKEVIVCPDSMFHMRPPSVTQDLTTFMTDRDLYEVQTVNGHIIRTSCKAKYSIKGSKALSPCSVQSNADLIKLILRLCEESNIICELQEGTALGAVKLGNVLPWERDGDLTFLSGNFSILKSLKSEFWERKIGFTNSQPQWCCADNRTAGGAFHISTSAWTIELYGQHIMDSEIMKNRNMEPTKVLFDGQWVNVPRNPGLFVRNRYGHEVYQHALHWMTTGARTGWAPYKTNMFMKCSNPGDHDCLDRYNTDGSLTFEFMLP